MTAFTDGRALLGAVRSNLDEWLSAASEVAYTDLFEGDDAILTEDQLRVLDQLDSRLAREQGQGLWGADTYGIVQTGTPDEESVPHVVCTNHPQLPEHGFPGPETLDDDTRMALNEALWEYCERVVEHAQHELEGFVWSAEVESWNE